MNISKITSAFALTLAVSALPAMALNTTGVYNNSNYPGQSQGQHQGQRHGDRLKAMDRNGDGIITRDEWQGNDASFQKHDRNGDGVISQADRQHGNNGTRQNRQRD